MRHVDGKIFLVLCWGMGQRFFFLGRLSEEGPSLSKVCHPLFSDVLEIIKRQSKNTFLCLLENTVSLYNPFLSCQNIIISEVMCMLLIDVYL